VKSSKKKKMLGKALKQNRRLPLFVMARTGRRVTANIVRRRWRNEKMKLKVDDDG
jgi:large subunit ribosomal protein L39e